MYSPSIGFFSASLICVLFCLYTRTRLQISGGFVGADKKHILFNNMYCRQSNCFFSTVNYSIVLFASQSGQFGPRADFTSPPLAFSLFTDFYPLLFITCIVLPRVLIFNYYVEQWLFISGCLLWTFSNIPCFLYFHCCSLKSICKYRLILRSTGHLCIAVYIKP